MTARVLVAGIGNLFLGDDGFGPEVVRRLAAGGSPPPGVRVTDYGIRGMHLAYDLLDGWDTLILVDALPATSGPPGQVVVVEVGPGDLEPAELDAHGMQPVAVLGSLTAMGGTLPPTYVVGCPVESTREGIGLTPAMSAAVPVAIDVVLDLLDHLPSTVAPARPSTAPSTRPSRQLPTTPPAHSPTTPPAHSPVVPSGESPVVPLAQPAGRSSAAPVGPSSAQPSASPTTPPSIPNPARSSTAPPITSSPRSSAAPSTPSLAPSLAPPFTSPSTAAPTSALVEPSSSPLVEPSASPSARPSTPRLAKSRRR